MTLLPRGLKVHLALGYTDMRKGIDGLAMLVQAVWSCPATCLSGGFGRNGAVAPASCRNI